MWSARSSGAGAPPRRPATDGCQGDRIVPYTPNGCPAVCFSAVAGVLASIVIPAHNEAESIRSVLRALAPLRGDAEVVVVCNGCGDSTASLARQTSPWASVLELSEPSKSRALQAGDEAVAAFPRLYLDGDIVIGADDVCRLRDYLLELGLDGVSPTPRYDTAGASMIVRSHYRWWAAAQAAKGTLTGAGAIMVSADVRRRFAEWPNVLADDYFLDGLMGVNAKRRVGDVSVTVRSPRRFAECVSRRARVRRGNSEVIASGLRLGGPPPRAWTTAIGVVRSAPALLFDLPAHALVVVSASGLGAWRRFRATDKVFYRDRSRQVAG